MIHEDRAELSDAVAGPAWERILKTGACPPVLRMTAVGAQ